MARPSGELTGFTIRSNICSGKAAWDIKQYLEKTETILNATSTESSEQKNDYSGHWEEPLSKAISAMPCKRRQNS